MDVGDDLYVKFRVLGEIVNHQIEEEEPFPAKEPISLKDGDR